MESPFESFFGECQRDAWITAHGWDEAENLATLRGRWRVPEPDTSRSHKKRESGRVAGVWVQGKGVGVDLETLRPPRALWVKDPERVAKRLGLSSGSSSLDLMRNWCLREACFKALRAGEGESDDLRLENIHALSAERAVWVVNKKRRATFGVRAVWNEEFFLCVAKLT